MIHESLRYLSRLVVVITWLASHPALGDGLLTLTTVLDDGHELTPVRIEVRDEAGGFHIASDAMRVAHGLQDNPVPLEKGIDLQAYLDTLQKTVGNYFERGQQFYSAGVCSLRLPAGEYRIRVSKGPEFLRESRVVAVEEDHPIRIEVRMRRWIDMPADGWYSADAHVHVPRPGKEVNPHIATWLSAEDLHVTNLLQWGHIRHFNNAPQYAHGPEGIFKEGLYILASGQENPRSPLLGHTIILGAKSPIHDERHYPIYQHAFAQARREGGVNGYAHKAVNHRGQNGMAIDLSTGLVDFIEVLQFSTADYSVWYNALNAGYRITPVAGTDYPVGPIPGWERFYAYVPAPYSFESWLEAVRAGRVFVTNGPMLEFEIEGAMSGTVLSLDGPRELNIRGAVKFDANRDAINVLELVENGRVVAHWKREEAAQEIRFETSHRVSGACWLALRASGLKRDAFVPTFISRQPRHSGPAMKDIQGWIVSPALAHSGAVYVDLRGHPSLAESATGHTARLGWIARLHELETMLHGNRIREVTNDELGPTLDAIPLQTLLKHIETLREAIDTAEERYLE